MLRECLVKFVEDHPSSEDTFRKFIFTTQKQELTQNERQYIFEKLAEFMVARSKGEAVGEHFSQYFPIILSLAVPTEAPTSTKCTVSSHTHTARCVLLSEVLKYHPDALNHALQYFEHYPAPFETISDDQIPPQKRQKLTVDEKYRTYQDSKIIDATLVILKAAPNHFKHKWNWSKFFVYLRKKRTIRHKALKCLSIVLDMSEATTTACLRALIPDMSEFIINLYSPERSIDIPFVTFDRSDIVKSAKTSDSLVYVAGVLLPILKRNLKSQSQKLIPVLSMEQNLRSLALGVAARKPVCLQGPVGCGKTALVEYLANITGRGASDMIKVQLGDQTDSKMLLGTYRCTDIPGEFVWQPGVLTQAVLAGKWLLLEDIDSAALDVASVLSNLMETGTLSVPGFRDLVHAKTGFQLFVTRRLIPTMSGLFKQTTSASGLLEKHWLCVHMDPLTRDELIKIVQTLFPVLSTIATRIVDVFLLFSSGYHEAGNESLSLKTGRLISTRDLIKWCARTIVGFDVSSPDSGLKVLQDAIDIFCCSVPDQSLRLELAIAIGNTLGIVKTKSQYFVDTHKPSVLIQPETFSAGRAKISRKNAQSVQFNETIAKFSFTRPSASLLERVTTCVSQKEPVLLVGETGTGKTSSVQFLARSTGHKLIVINMNQQSESADLIGGFKPVDMKILITPIREEFETLFRAFFATEPNRKFLEQFGSCYVQGKWRTLVLMMCHSAMAAVKRLTSDMEKKLSDFRESRKRGREDDTKELLAKDEIVLSKWLKLLTKLEKLKTQVKSELSLAFAFIEGSLVKALQEGHWVLLDEINLASSETLECLSGLLEGSTGSLALLERGDNESIKRHNDFTMFACMNPATDVGKKELPVGLRNRFTEFYVDELTEPTDLQLLVSSYLADLNLPSNKVESIVKFYLNVRKEATNSLSDGTGHKPHFSLRTLCRALSVASTNPCGNVLRSLYEAFCLSFLTQLDQTSYPIVLKLITEVILDRGTMKGVLGAPIPKPKCGINEDYINFEGYWVIKGSLEPDIPNNYILTKSVRRNLKDLVRVVSIGKMPVLLQGDTSVGKTSLITYLAKASGHVCVRINNHEHTDLQEYVGNYVASETGKLVFKEGALVEAMRKGYWIILDELNLAPSDVLEALNRVLDDNRELFIPETQETIKAHSNFMLFATQNPPGLYGGRKVLSRAFRNRFVELHFDEIPSTELQVILHERCHMPESYCKQIISVMTELQMRRKSTAAFLGKQGFITLRDLFRWGERYRLALDVGQKLYDWSQHLADEGYLVLAAKVRKPEEAEEIRQVIKKHLKRDVDPSTLFTLNDKTSTVTRPILESILTKPLPEFKHVVWTYHMRRMAVLVTKSCQFKEPVLLVGETGGGKTTVCQLAAAMTKRQLWSVNCHMHTESSDFLGNLRPVRDHSDEKNQKLFEWVDGPLITAMKAGDVFLADEISLADDSVLERMNSLLEPERTLLLAEKSTDSNVDSNEVESVITAHEDFCFIGTMNPGGDYGKKELSPALRNRFTEIWCEGCTDNNDLQLIIEHNLKARPPIDNKIIAKAMISFLDWLKLSEVGKRFSVSIRDVLTWVDFINSCHTSLSTSKAFFHGASLTYIDSLGSGVTGTESTEKLEIFRKASVAFLNEQIDKNFAEFEVNLMEVDNIADSDSLFGVYPFYVEVGPNGKSKDVGFTFTAPTTQSNTMKLLRALQLKKPLLLEGSPGVGKTSLVSAIAKASGHSLLRINLSDQTDVSDLFGADLPLEGGKGGQFAWKDGPFLRALRAGDWILLDELNLASQSVLEGLNACLDHRGEVYIPELGKTFTVKPGTKLFGCQNPLRQGGARRGLPKSFLNRFTQVYVDALSDDDLQVILDSQFPDFPENLLPKIVAFNSRLASEAGSKWGYSGAPWEMNLRDITRFCELLDHYKKNSIVDKNIMDAIELIYIDRMRSLEDRQKIREIAYEVLSLPEVLTKHPTLYMLDEELYFDDVAMKRTDKSYYEDQNLLVMREQLPVLKSLAYCVNMNWMPILVGPSGSGKSSVVRVLAQLAGQKLRSIVVNSAMDTTEILGGFEQTDYNRHLEQLISDTEDILISSTIQNLQKNKLRGLDELHRRLEEIKNLSYDENQIRTRASELAEIDNFLQRIEQLLNLTSIMKTVETIEVTVVEEIEARLKNLGDHVREDRCLNAGGKFEWIDSVLVKCLQDGSWLLVDQVNLCSPAVLDRLNGLLEPGGVLTIGERGTDTSGNVHTIKPHPNFRLFLTMDPQYGEISRAMRNRGVEIYLLPIRNKLDSSLDLKSQLYNLGLTSEHHQMLLLHIHQAVSDDNSTCERLGISQLLHAGSLIAQQVQRKFPIIDAFRYACQDVYIKSRYIQERTQRKRLISIIDEAINVFTKTNYEPSFINIQDLTPAIHNLQSNALLTLAKQQAIIGSALKKKLDETDSDDNKFTTELLNRALCPLFSHSVFIGNEVYNHFLINFLEKASVNDFHHRVAMLDEKVASEFTSDNKTFFIGHNLLHMIKYRLSQSPNAGLPWHPAYSPCAFDQQQFDAALKFALTCYAKIMKCLSITIESDEKSSMISVGKISLIANNEDIPPDLLYAPVILLFLPIVEFMKKWLNAYLAHVPKDMSYKDYIRLRMELLALTSFGEQGKVKVPRKYYEKSAHSGERKIEVTQVLKIHYERVIKFIQQTIDESKEVDAVEVLRLRASMEQFLNQARSILDFNNASIRKFTSALRKTLKTLPPFASNTAITNYNSIQRIIKELSPMADFTTQPELKWMLRLMLIQRKESVELRRDLIKAWQDVFINKNDTSETIARAERLCDEYRNCQSRHSDVDQSVSTIFVNRDHDEVIDEIVNIQLWPIYEFAFLLLTNKLQKIACDKMMALETDSSAFAALDHFVDMPSIPVNLIAILQTINDNNQVDYSHVSELFYQLEGFRDKSLAFVQPSAILNFNDGTRKVEDSPASSISENDDEIILDSFPGPTLIVLLSHLLLTNPDENKDKSAIKLTNLDYSGVKVNQLKILNEILWKNSICFNCLDFDFHQNDYHTFVAHLNKYIKSIEELVGNEEAQNMACSPQRNYIEIMKNYPITFTESLEELEELRMSWNSETQEEVRNVDVALMWIFLGLHQLFTFSYIEIIDPIQRVDLDLEFVELCIKDLEHMIYAIALDAHVLGDYNIDKRDPRIFEAHQALERMNSQRDELLKSKGFRIADPPYSHLFEELRMFRGSFPDPMDVIQGARNLHLQVRAEIQDHDADMEEFRMRIVEVMDDARVEARTLEELGKRLEKKFLANYRELVHPILMGIAQIQHGVKILIETGEHVLGEKESHFDISSNAQLLLLNLVRFPTIGVEQENLLQLIDLCTCECTREFVNFQLSRNNHAESLIEQFRMLKNSLFELYNHTSLTGTLNPKTWEELNRLLHQIMIIWSKKKMVEEEERKSNARLFKNRAQLKGENLTEEEEINEELRKLFPTHHTDDFQDVEDIQSSLDSSKKLEPEEQREKISFKHLMTEEDLEQVYAIHSKIVQHFVAAPWLSNSAPDQRNYIHPLLERYKTFSTLLPKVKPALSLNLSSKLVASFNILTSVAAAECKGEMLVHEAELIEKPYDFYKSENVEEVKQCRPILESILKRTNEFLERWPEHPTLIWIRKIIFRIFSFPVTSSISRFLTGLELLLVKLKEWEENAHSGVSVADCSAALTRQIIEWRKLELHCWKNCLENAFTRLNAATSKWWFLIYGVIEAFLNKKPVGSDTVCEDRMPQEGAEKATPSAEDQVITAKKLVERLETFMTQSPIVEFQARLDLLLTFHGHVYCMKASPERNQLLAIFWNVYNYYSQFSKDVQVKITAIKAPIEKKLKDFVKIARWNDISYWAVKETVEKTHRTLLKFIREYEQGLKQNVGSCLVVKSSNYDLEAAKGEWDRPKDRDYAINPKAFTTSMTYQGTVNLVYQSVLMSQSQYFVKKAKNLCEKTIVKASYSKMRSELEQFIVDTMDHSVRLKNMEVDRTLAKNKQKSHAKSILQQKKMALADYFKTMANFGISYRKGLLALKNHSDDINDMTIPPIDVTSAFKKIQQSPIDQHMLVQWNGCQTYFYKCQIKLNALNSAFTKVQTDLGVSNMERCSGLSNHLMLLVNNQKRVLAENFHHFLNLRQQIEDLMKIGTEDVDLPCHEDMKSCAGSLEDLLYFLRLTYEQLAIYLHACPEEPGVEKQREVLILQTYDSPLVNTTKNSAVWTATERNLKKCAGTVKKLYTNHQKLFSNMSMPVIRTQQHYNYLKSTEEEISKFLKINDDFQATFGVNHPVCCSIRYMSEKIQNWKAGFRGLKMLKAMTIDFRDISLAEFAKDAESLMENVLLAVQQLYKTADEENKALDENKKTTDAEEEDEASLLGENGLREKLIESLGRDLINLRLNEIGQKIGDLWNRGQMLSPIFATQVNAIWRRLLPLFKQYSLFSQFYLNEQVATFRTSCKLMYLQLNVFLDLATNGFCVPKDLDIDEAENDEDGIQQDSDKGGMGLADGEGKKDVSDRIESEDQLEDARPAGEEQESKEDKDCKEEEKGIDMSDNFDSKLQDIEKDEDDDDEEEDKDEDDDDMDKEIGETEEGTDQLDDEIWGDDEEEKEDESTETDEQGSGEKSGEKEMTAKDDKTKENRDEEDENKKENNENGEEEKKEINEMNEPDVNDDQINPYHGNQEPAPEPEAMDLPEDLNLDDGEAKDDNPEGDENPFDIDEMKESMPPPPPPEVNEPEEQGEEQKDKDDEPGEDSSDEEEGNGQSNIDPEVKDLDDQDEENADDGTNQVPEEGTKKDEPEPEIPPEEKEKINEEQAVPSATDNSAETDAAEQAPNPDGSHDKVPDKESKNDTQESAENNQEDGEDKGTGQAQSKEPEHGHVGTSADKNTPAQRQQMEQKQLEKRKNPGESDENRALVDNIMPDKKRQKMIHSRDESAGKNQEEEEDENGAEEGKEGEVDLCQHVKDTEKFDNYAVDAATEEQAKKQKTADDKDDNDEIPDENEDKMDVDMHEDEILEDEEVKPLTQNADETEKSEKEKEKSKTSSKGQNLEDAQMENKVDVEGDNIETMNVQRSAESAFYTNLLDQLDSVKRIEEKRQEVETMLGQWCSAPTTEEALVAWNCLCAVTEASARDLSEKLRLVLEPTQATRLKGDYRTGKRINMRKIIPYIASQFRKDKIWLRRTKPSKRDYQIVLALDDSSSMADNHSKELAFESLSLISKAMGFLEVGELGVLSFGESPKVLHPLGEPFTEQSGARLMQEMKFDQKKTMMGQLVNYTVNLFENQRSSTDNAKLLVVLSDGRGIFSEGIEKVNQAVRRAKLADIFLVFIIVENPNSKDSILDIRMPVFENGKLMGIKAYMDSFPFPFYMILRDINALPGVLSDALRQWFEVVGKIDT